MALRCQAINKHDKHLQQLLASISNDYEVIYTNYPLFSKRKRKIAEIDVLAVSGNRVDIFEVKCSHRIVKATKQLRKIRTLLKDAFKNEYIQTFFYCGASESLLLIQ